MWIFLGFTLTLGFAYTIYFSFNHGMSHSARGQQTRRMLFATIAAWLPMVVGWTLMPFVVGGAWMLTYPLLYHLTNRKVSPDYENYADTTFGIYLIGWLTTLTLLATLWPPLLALVGVVEFVLLLPVVFMWGYYIIYGVCVDSRGLLLVQETDLNEVFEFVRSFKWWSVLTAVMTVAMVLVGCIAGNTAINVKFAEEFPLMGLSRVVELILLFCYAMAVGWYLFGGRQGFVLRTGLLGLVRDVEEYMAEGKRYLSGRKRRIGSLQVIQRGVPYDKPHTILLVIGESASRDYMSAFSNYPHDTTPWMRIMTEDKAHTHIFKHAYSCTMHTVQVLEKALTEMNQYGAKGFEESCSIIDISQALNYKVSWFSNQGHLGVFDTRVTILAGTCDQAKWTMQTPGVVQYDSSLLSFLNEIDGGCNNLVILHLLGSHFNFLNRYPNETHTVWGAPGVQDDVLNYENSLRFTDEVLQKAFEFCRDRLNLKAMVYCSDHATMPDRRRTPNFNGFRNMRIPLFVWTDDEFLLKHAERAAAMKHNAEQYFTNDLLYELMLGIFDVECNYFDEGSSLAYDHFRYKREDLLTFDGQRRVADDDELFVTPNY